MSNIPPAPEAKYGPGAEQDRYGSRFGVKEETTSTSWFSRVFSSGKGAEQDRYDPHLGLSEEAAARAKAGLTSGPGAEQDRYAAHFSLPRDAADRIKRGLTPGQAEQDRYASHWGLDEETAERIKRGLTSGPGAEQDRYGSRFGMSNETIQEAKEAAAYRASSGIASGGEQDRLGSHFSLKPTNPMGPGSVGVVGILQSTILPTFAINSGLGLIAYAGSRYTDRLDVKDTIRPLAPVVNAWWMAVGRRMYYFGIPFSLAWNQMSYSEKLVLGGITAHGLKMFYLQVTRSMARGEDEPRYQVAKKEPSFWDKAALNTFLPEAAFQTLVALPFTLAFRLGPSVALTPAPAFAELAHNLAVFLFGSGFALQTVSDYQLSKHQTVKPERLHRRGPWSIVRHPNYLGDFHVYASFPLLLYSCGLLHPLALVAPAAQYVYLRYFSGDVQMEQHEEQTFQTTNNEKYQQLQEYKATKNAFWPKVEDLTNPWYLGVVAVGVGCAVVERGIRQYILH